MAAEGADQADLPAQVDICEVNISLPDWGCAVQARAL